MPFPKAIPSSPPAYQPLDINAAIRQACEAPEHDEASRQLRRFLSFCLAADYYLVHDWDEILLRKEWLYWLEFSRELLLHYQRLILADWRAPLWGERVPPVNELTKNMWQKIDLRNVCPAISIGVPPDIAVCMVFRYQFTLSYVVGHMPIVDGYRRHTAKDLASKLLADGDLLFDVLVTESKLVTDAESNEEVEADFRTLLNRKHEKVCKKYFDSLESPNFTLTAWASAHGGILQVDTIFISRMSIHDGPGMWFLTKLFAALPEEGKGKAKAQQGGLERWTRKKAHLFFGRSD